TVITKQANNDFLSAVHVRKAFIDATRIASADSSRISRIRVQELRRCDFGNHAIRIGTTRCPADDLDQVTSTEPVIRTVTRCGRGISYLCASRTAHVERDGQTSNSSAAKLNRDRWISS